MQQELIIACSDLMTHNPAAFDGVLTIRLAWLMEAIDLLLEFLKEVRPRRQSFNKKILSGYLYGFLPTFKFFRVKEDKHL